MCYNISIGGFTSIVKKTLKIGLILILSLGALAGIAALFYFFNPLAQLPSSLKITGSGSWSVFASSPTKRGEVGSAVLDGKIYVVGGVDEKGKTLATVEIFDPVKNEWTKGLDLPNPLNHVAVASTLGKLLVIGGFTNMNWDPVDLVYIFDPATNTWTEGPKLPSKAGALSAITVGNLIYCIGGRNSQGDLGDTSVLDPKTGKWEMLSAMPTPRNHLAIGEIDGKIYAAGGRTSIAPNNLNALEIYDTTTDEWTKGPNMPTQRSGIGGAVLDGKFHVIGGESFFQTFKENEAYDPESKKWEEFPPLPTTRQGVAVSQLQDLIFVINGGNHQLISASDTNEAFSLKETPVTPEPTSDCPFCKK